MSADPAIRIDDLTTTSWRVVARQPVSTMRWTYFVPPYDLRDPATRRRVQTVTRRDPDAYVLLARLRP